MTQKWAVSAVVDLDEMTLDPNTDCYTFPCRCGGAFVVGEVELEEGVELVCCNTCSLSIRITYQQQ